MSGQIADESGEPLIGAAVVAVHEPSGTQYYATTNNDGRYTITGMRAGGPYTVEISFIGMATERHTDVTLQLGETYVLNSKMKYSELLDEVLVIASTSKFTTAKTGAAININDGTTLATIVNSNFTGNSVRGPQGAPTTGAMGGAICVGYNVPVTVNIDNCNFTGNYAAEWGAALSLDRCKDVTITGCNFKDGSSAMQPGAYLTQCLRVSINNCNFTNNSATASNTGCIAFNTVTGAIGISNCRFTNNSAVTMPGVIWIQANTPNVRIVDSVFDGNRAGSDAGAIYAQGANLTLINTNFTNNVAGDEGGAIVFASSAINPLTGLTF
jgi:hypothetical protein